MKQHIRGQIERSLGLPGLFSAKSRKEVIELIQANSLDEGELPNARIIFKANSQIFLPDAMDAEVESIDKLSEVLLTSDEPVVHWEAPFNAGASYTAMNVFSNKETTKKYSRIVIIRPSDYENPFEAEIRALTDELELLGHRVNTKRAVVEALHDERILLVVLSPKALDYVKDKNSLRTIIKILSDRRGNWGHPSCCLIVGKSSWAAKTIKSEYRSLTELMKVTLRVRGASRFDEFLSQWNRFSSMRNYGRSEESGSRMRRAATYYNHQNKDDVWPISIKMRALFASNERTAAYFDPTQGFGKLAGNDFRSFEDILAYYEDVRDYIFFMRYIDEAANQNSRIVKKHYYLLQYASTAKHWLTEDALNELIEKIPSIRKNKLNLKTEKKRLLSLDPIVTGKSVATGDAKQLRFYSSLAVKAAIQDDWITSDPFTRSLAHYRIAHRLKENEHNKGLLATEFPYQPHWGRSRVFFVAEAIRHFIRSMETYQGEIVPSHDDSDVYPEEPVEENKGTDPVQVINYCYSTLFQDGLNGNSTGKRTRALTKRHGAYQLAVELLELMSHENRIGVPHIALSDSKAGEFIKECAFALLEVGDLIKAKALFNAASLHYNSEDTKFEKMDSLLDETIVDAALGLLSNVQSTLELVSSQIDEIHKDHKKLNSLEFKRLRKIKRRLISRQAHYEFLENNYDVTLELLEKISTEDTWLEYKTNNIYPRHILIPSFSEKLEAEQVHLLIAALHRKAKLNECVPESETEELSLALNLCLESMLMAQSEGLHHQAMGFRILLARCFRRMDKDSTAETILDTVHNDLLSYGCSERTFLAFLNEAGRVLAKTDKVRAYATYLRPAFWRGLSRGFKRDYQQAASFAKSVLEELLIDFDEVSKKDLSEWEAILKKSIDDHNMLRSKMELRFSGGLFEKDPLFGYAIADAGKLILELDSADNIRKQILEIDTELQKANSAI